MSRSAHYANRRATIFEFPNILILLRRLAGMKMIESPRRSALAWVAVLPLLLLPGLSVTAQGNEDSTIWTGRESVAFSFDNDLLFPGNSEDADFTGGLAFTYSGVEALASWNPLHRGLDRLDKLLGIRREDVPALATPALEIGTYGFTPKDVTQREVLRNDRPYSSLVYINANRNYLPLDQTNSSWSSSLTVGVLGLNIFGEAQNALHSLIDNKEARGWDNQISEGGELTFRYQLAYHRYWHRNSATSQIKTSYFGSIGYLTEFGVSISTRQGKISSASHRFNPELISYGERVNELALSHSRGEESYFWAGMSAKARFYNAFLQGQVRDSKHTFHADELSNWIVEVWLGYTHAIQPGLTLSYVVHAQSPEIREGDARRHLTWGGLVLSQTL